MRDYCRSILSFSTQLRNSTIPSTLLYSTGEDEDEIANQSFVYCYDPVPPIHYPQLSEEMYCCGYYLRNLCNATKFPSWEIHDPVGLLRAVLDAWRAEKTKAQGDDTMSFTEASRILGLDISNKTAIQAMNKKCCERPTLN